MFSSSTGCFNDFADGVLNSITLSISDVKDALSKASLGTGIDLIPGSFLRFAVDDLAFHVYKLFDVYKLLLSSAVYPEQWTFSYITPIFKSGNNSDIKCYRPISIRSKLSLVFERVVYDKLYPFIINKISKRQFGFLRKKCCQAQLLAYLHDILEALNTNANVFSIYLDFSKAFDKVPHDIFLEKLGNFGFVGKILKLLHSYPHSAGSVLKSMGSILGPLLFIIFIIDLPDYCLNSCMFLFADDSKCRATNLYDLQLDVIRLLEWARKNGMPFIFDKTVFIHFANRHVLPKPFYLTFDESVISYKSKVKDLGLKLSINLKWKLHLNWNIKNCYGIFSSLKLTIPFRTPMHDKSDL